MTLSNLLPAASRGFYRIGDADAVTSDPESPITRVELRGSTVALHWRTGGTLSLEPGLTKEQDAELADWRAFVGECPPLLLALRVRGLRALRASHRDPYLEEAPRALFALFQAGAAVRQPACELRLFPDGSGAVWQTDGTACLLSWVSFEQGLRLLAAWSEAGGTPARASQACS